METILFNIQCDVPNANGRMYPRSVIESMVEQMNSKKPVLITAGRSDNPRDGIPLNRVVGTVKGAKIDENGFVQVTYDQLNTPLKALLDCDHDLVSVGFGKVSEGVISDYKLQCLACVSKENPDGNNNNL